MNTLHVAESALTGYSHAFGRTLSIDELRNRTPAAFAGNASTRTRQGSDSTYAQHMIRLRPIRQNLTLLDCIPE